MTIVIKNGHVLDLNQPFEPADILIDGSRIVRVGRNLGANADRVLDASGKIVMPGLINAHTHSGQIVERGFGENLPMELWGLIIYSGPLWSEQELYSLAAWSGLVQLKTGCTASLDHPAVRRRDVESEFDAIMQAYVDVGCRAAVAPLLVDTDRVGTMPLHLLGENAGAPPDTQPSSLSGLLDSPQAPAPELLDEARRFLRRWKGRSDRLEPFIGPIAPQRCTDELLAGCFELADEFDTSVHTHLHETRLHRVVCDHMYRGSVVDYFHARGWLGPRLSLAHGVWIDQAEMKCLAEAQATVVHNPVSNLRLGSGIANLQLLLANGTPVALGADGAASNDAQNMWEVLKLTALLHKIYGRRADWVTAEQALRLCWEGGAGVFRRKLGAIQSGFEADLMILDSSELFLRPKELMIPTLVYSEFGQSVRTVLVAGEVVVNDGKSTKIDEARLRDDVAALVEKSIDLLGRRLDFFGQRLPFMEKVLAAVDAQAVGPRRRVELS